MTVAVWDPYHHPVAGVLVTGAFSIGGSRVTCTTGSNGSCVLTTGILGIRQNSTTFTVTSLALRTIPYVPSMNVKSSTTALSPLL